MPVFIGMGCDRNTSLVTLETALAQALQLAGLTPAVITAFASIDKKADEVALLVLAQQYGCPLHFYTAEQLASVPVPNPSEVVRHYMGTPAVAEAAALLAANTTLEHLLVEKHKYRGADDKNATVSIVRI
jgi:cobalt-precorrin 5A hydrolase